MAGDANFGGVTFDCEVNNLGRKADTEITYQHIPGSNITYGDISGQLQKQIPMKLYFSDPADYLALEVLVSTQGTLVYVDGTFANALLKSLSRAERYQGTGQTTAQAEFVLLD